jgi:AcrR family transcriptional regulator
VKSREYTQRARAEAAEANTVRILEAALELFREQPFEKITLNEIARRAGVGVQTVIRRYGSKDGLSRAVNEWMRPQIAELRGVPDGDDPGSVADAIARHYERWGDLTERMLSQAQSSPALAEAAEGGRVAHRDWVAEVFAAQLTASADPRALRAKLVAVCGVQFWSVLRRDEGLSETSARNAVADLITVCTKEP